MPKFTSITALALAAALSASPVLHAEGEFLSSLEKDVTGLVAKVRPSLVTIQTIKVVSFESFSLPEKGVQSRGSGELKRVTKIGSGIIFDGQGHILTSASVVTGGNEFKIVLYNGQALTGELVGLDQSSNLAVLRVDGSNLRPASFGNSNELKSGSWVTVLGNSFGMPTAVSIGLVNGIRPDGLIQMSAAVSPGGSGSPVINSQGDVVGLVVAKISESSNISILSESEGAAAKVTGSQGRVNLPTSSVSLAIPMNHASEVAVQIIRQGSVKRGFLGIYLDDIPGQSGILISEVIQSSPADRAGLLAGDVVVEFDGQSIKNSQQFRSAVQSVQPLSQVEVKVVRQDQVKSLKATLGTPPPFPEVARTDSESEENPTWTSNNSGGRNFNPSSNSPTQIVNQQQDFELTELKRLYRELQDQFMQSQGGFGYTSSENLEKRIMDLQLELDAYRKALLQMQLELEELKAAKSEQ